MIYDVKRVSNPKLTVEKLQTETAHKASHRPTPQSVSQTPNNNSNSTMARRPAQHTRTRLQNDRQEKRLKELQMKILQKLHHIQHFNICNTAAVPTVSMALYRRNTALTVREHINSAMDLLNQEPQQLPEEIRFRHYPAIFTLYRGMVYREEIRLDKIIDDLQEYVQYTQEHGVPRPPINPNPNTIPYGLRNILADISDTSSDDEDDYTTTNPPSPPSDYDDDDPRYTPTSPQQCNNGAYRTSPHHADD
jgi:hypothetical protein